MVKVILTEDDMYNEATCRFETPPETRNRLLKMRDTERAKKDEVFHNELKEKLGGVLEEVFLEGMKTGQGAKVQTEHGAIRESNAGRGRFDLLPYEALEAWAIWSELGAVKYGDRNWENGLSVKDCINRMCRHAAKAANGMTDEDHLAAVMWNAAVAITMMQRRPDCNDHIWQRTENQPNLNLSSRLVDMLK